MGTSFCHKEPGQSLFDFFKKECGDGLIDISQKGWSTAYAAYRMKDGKVCGLVIHLYRSRDYYNFGWKVVDEMMGPYECECPERILKLLSPPEEFCEGTTLEWSKRWRDQCWENIKKGKNPSTKISLGKKYQITQKIEFTNGDQLNPGDLVECWDAKRRVFIRPGDPMSRFRFGQNAREYIKAVA